MHRVQILCVAGLVVVSFHPCTARGAVADLESCIKTFRVYRDGRRIGDYRGVVHKRHNPDGGFQKGNYGDAPTSATPEGTAWSRPTMEFIDTRLERGVTYTYQVSTINWSGLESARSTPVKITCSWNPGARS